MPSGPGWYPFFGCPKPLDCGRCSDADVVFLATLAGIVDGLTIPTPPSSGTCAACADRNTTYPLVKTDALTDIPSGCISGDDPRDISIPFCAYRYRQFCGITGFGECFYQTNNLFDVELFVYRTVGGNIRGYLQVLQQVIFNTGGDPPFCLGNFSVNRTTVSAADFLLGADVAKIACLDVDVAGDFTLCSDTGAKYYCDPPASFQLTAEAA